MLDWIEAAIAGAGALGVAALMLLENVFPPIPSELIMPLAGYFASLGRASFGWVLLGGAAGSVLGAWAWYEAGRRLGLRRVRALAARHGRWLTLTPTEVDRAVAWFRRHGRAAVFLGRLAPGLRTVISIPAGVARMHRGVFLAWTTLGSTLWCGALAGAGWLLGAGFGMVDRWLEPVSTLALAGAAAIYAWRVATYGRRVAREEAAAAAD